MQLSAKALLRPFSSTPTTDPVDAMKTNTSDSIHNDVDNNDIPNLEEIEDDDEEDEGCEDKDVGEEDEDDDNNDNNNNNNNDDDDNNDDNDNNNNVNDNDDDNNNNDNDEDPFDGLTSEESQELMNDTASVKTALDKVH
jgi:hypothetical protein